MRATLKPEAAVLLEQRPTILGLAVLAVLTVTARSAFDLFPVYENDLRRQDADQVGPFHNFVTLAAAVRRLVGPAMQFERTAASCFHFQRVEAATDQRPAEARVVVGELDPEHAFAGAPQHVDLLDREVDDVPRVAG